MSASGSRARSDRSAEERAEELMERVANDASRLFSRMVGRAREEIEDVVAEARTLKEDQGQRSSRSSSG